MSSSAEGSSSPLLPPIRPADGFDRVPLWGLGRQDGRRRWSRRTLSIAVGCALVSSLTGILTWATTRIGTAPPVAVTLLGSDYRNNLQLPPNGMGDRALGQFAAWVSGTHSDARRRLSLTQPPIEWAEASDLERIDSPEEAAVSLFFVSAHGVSTASGPAILPSRATQAAEAVPVQELIARMARLPEEQQKVLILDCVHFLSHPPLGVILNDFARQMRALDDEIRAVPNLVVLLSTQPNEQSWVDPSLGTTHFAGVLLQALNGEALDLDGDGWIDLFEVFRATESQTRQWVQQTCGQSQQPCLLPLGEAGIVRSRGVGFYPARLDPAEVPSLIAPTREARLEHWWREHSKYQTRRQPASLAFPVLWRRFEAMLLRFEQFELAGCRDAANSTETELASIARDLDVATRIDSMSCRSGVLSPETVGFDVSQELEAAADELTGLLAAMPLPNAVDHWADVVTNQPNGESVAYLRRAIIESQTQRLVQTLKDQVIVDRDQLARSARLARIVGDPLQPLPQTGMVLQFLDRDLPPEDLSSRDATNIGRFLELTQRCDRVSKTQLIWDSRTFAWVDDVVQRADQARRSAGDLLFGDVDARQRAESFLETAEKDYAEADRISDLVAKAEAIRVGVPAEFRRLGNLLSARTIAGPEPTARRDVDTFTQLCRYYDQIESLLDTGAPSTDKQREERLEQLSDLTAKLKESLDTLRADVDARQRASLVSITDRLPVTLAAFQASGGSAADRLEAWRHLRHLASAPDGASLSPASIPTDRQIQQGARLRGRLALAPWPSRLFDSLQQPGSATKAQVAHRLEVFSGETAWWKPLMEAEEQIRQRERMARRRLSNVNVTRLALLHRLSTVPALDFHDLEIADRRQCFSDFLCWQRERFLADAYAAFDPERSPYFARVARLMTSDLAEQGVQHDQSDEPVPVDRLGIELSLPDTLAWTTQLSEQFPIRVYGSSAMLRGFVALQVDGKGRIEVAQPAAGQRACRPLISEAPAKQQKDTTQAAALDTGSELWVQLRRSNTDALPAANRGPDIRVEEKEHVRVRGYFRGRWLDHRVDIPFQETPEIHIVEPPRSRGGKIALRSDDSGLSGTGGAVALVLDCSGSMGAPRGEPFDDQAKYAHAVTAVEDLLAELPSGIRLSVWAFGQAVGESKTARPAERAIQRIQAPLTWDSRDPSLKRNLLSAIRYPQLEPWNESPVLAAMFAAADDLRGVDGIRSLVVITDGADNRIQNDPVTNPLGHSAETLIVNRFRGTDITVNVIAFRVESEEQAATRRQLACVESLLPPGRFVEAEEVGDLATALREMLRIRSAQQVSLVSTGQSEPAAKTGAVPISPAEGPAHWSDWLTPGLYRIQDGKQPGSLIRISDGDRLVLRHSAVGELSPWPAMDRELRWSPRRRLGNWNAALVPEPRSEPGSVARSLVLEGVSARGVLGVERPAELWIEAFEGDQRLPLRWQPDPARPGAVFAIEAREADEPTTGFGIWVSDREAVAAGRLIRGRDFQTRAELAPTTWNRGGGEVRLQSALIETHSVPTQDGQLRPQPCLVLRGSCPPGSRFRFRTKGLSPEGQDEQCFVELGQFTLRQWPVTEADLERSLKEVHLIAVDEFQREAERLGGHAGFTPAPKVSTAAMEIDVFASGVDQRLSGAAGSTLGAVEQTR